MVERREVVDFVRREFFDRAFHRGAVEQIDRDDVRLAAPTNAENNVAALVESMTEEASVLAGGADNEYAFHSPTISI